MISRRHAFAATAALLAAPRIAAAQARSRLRIGLGPQQPTQADTRRVWEPVYRQVCDRIGVDMQLTVANDWAGIATALANRQLDVAQMGPWGYVLAKARGEAEAIAMLLIEGRPYYKAIIVARPGLEITNFPHGAASLSMQMLDPGSTSGWLVPTYWLRSQGIEPRSFFRRYAEGASAAAAQMATIQGQVDLATGWDTHRNTMIRNGLMREDSNRVIWESEPLANEPVVVRAGFDEGMARALREALEDIPEAQARELLPVPYSGFVATDHAPYEPLERMGRAVGVLRA